MKLSKEEIKAIIPHRDPMLLVDTVEEMEAGDHIVTTFLWTRPARFSRATSPVSRCCPACTLWNAWPRRRISCCCPRSGMRGRSPVLGDQ